jgi:flagellar hook-associated protein 2
MVNLENEIDSNISHKEKQLFKLEEEKEKTLEIINNKYEQMFSQFAAYTAIITQMEASFSGLKMMMEMKTD